MIVLFIKNQIKLNSILKTKRYYRPISVLRILSKIAERHVHNAFDRPSTDYRPTIDRPSTDYRPTIDRPSTDHRPTIDRLSTDYQPTIDRLSTDYRPLYRPLCRPISQSTLPTVNKIHAFYSFLCENDLIYIRQSGFRSKHSTETALIKIIDDLLFNLDNDRVSGMVFIDYRKAFDMIDRTLLLKKLEVFGISRDSFQWFNSYLKDRRQLVKLGAKQSSVAIVRHGIPQGSILGLLLFIVFINNLRGRRTPSLFHFIKN